MKEINVDISTGNLDLIFSQVFFVLEDEETKLVMTSKEDPLTFILKFKNTDTESQTPKKEANLINKTTIEIIFYNYNNSLGTFLSSPAVIGSLYDRRLYMIYEINKLTNTKIKKVFLSFYLGEEVNNG